MQHDLRDLLTIDDAAALTGVTRRTVHRWIDAGVLVPVAVFASTPVFARADVEGMTDRRRTEKTA